MRPGGRPGDEQDIGSALQQPSQRHLHWRRIHALRHLGKRLGLERGETAQRKERNITDALPRKFIDQRIIIAMDQIVVVLHAHYFGDPLGLRHLRRGDIAEAQMPDQSLSLQIGQRRESFLDRTHWAHG